MGKYKIVDNFSGAEFEEEIDDKEKAEEYMYKLIDEIHSKPGQQNIICDYEVVPQDAEYIWSDRDNNFVWSWE